MTEPTLFEQVKAAREALQQAIAVAKVGGNLEFGRMAAHLFEKHPHLSAFRFKAFVPGFNDGDPCTYSRYGSDVLFPLELLPEGDGFDEDEEDEPSGWVSDGEYSDSEGVKAAAEDVEAFLEELGDDFLEAVFGYDVKITVHRDGMVENDDYYCGH
jgi:hypothetical protein